MKQSHLVRVEEKRARRRIYISLFTLIATAAFLYFGAVPLLTKFSLLLTSSGRDKNDTGQTDNSLLLPPHLEPVVEATNTATTSVKGFANPGDTVKVYVNDKELDKLLVGNDGQFSISQVSLKEGDNTIYATMAKGDKESSPSDMLKIAYIKTPPSLEVNEPSDGQTYYGDNKTINVRGKTDNQVKVYINDRLAIVGGDGSFSYPVSLNEGDNQIKIVAADPAGNQTTIQRKVTYKP